MPTALEIQHVEMTRVFSATPAAIFERLTTAAHLREWFSEHAEVEPRVNGAYRFWGRHTPVAHAPSDATQRITRFEPGTGLRYSWPWMGADTEVLIELSPDRPGATGPRTTVWVRHSLLGGTIGGHSREESRFFIEDFWGVAMGNLRQHLKTGRAALRPDFASSDPVARVSIEVDAPAARVWQALTDPAQMDKWLSKTGVCEARAGGAYAYGWVFDGLHCGPKAILEIDPPRRLVHDWFHSAETPSRTEWLLDPLPGDRTRVTISQLGVTPLKHVPLYTGGWAKFAFALRDLFETDPSAPSPR